MNLQLEKSWEKALSEEFSKPYYEQLMKFIEQEYKTEIVYPPAEVVFRAFQLCPFNKVKVVLLGQDPYHSAGQAMGLAFSVPADKKLPPSLRNINKELKTDLHHEGLASGNLTSWAEQGVLLLNATLTVQAGKAGSHQGKGWETFTDAVIKKLSDEKEHLVFILWGNYAQKKTTLINQQKHLVLCAAHPSPFSAERGFFGSRPFSKTNAYLQQNKISIINW